MNFYRQQCYKGSTSAWTHSTSWERFNHLSTAISSNALEIPIEISIFKEESLFSLFSFYSELDGKQILPLLAKSYTLELQQFQKVKKGERREQKQTIIRSRKA